MSEQIEVRFLGGPYHGKVKQFDTALFDSYRELLIVGLRGWDYIAKWDGVSDSLWVSCDVGLEYHEPCPWCRAVGYILRPGAMTGLDSDACRFCEGLGHVNEQRMTDADYRMLDQWYDEVLTNVTGKSKKGIDWSRDGF